MAIKSGEFCQLGCDDVKNVLRGDIPRDVLEQVLDAQGNEVSIFFPHCRQECPVADVCLNRCVDPAVREAVAAVMYERMPFATIAPRNGHITATASIEGLLQCPEMIPRALENLQGETEDDSFFELPEDQWRDHMQHARHFLSELTRDQGEISESDKKFLCSAECAEVLVQQLLRNLKGVTDTFQVASRGGALPYLPPQKLTSGNAYTWHPSTRGNMEVHKQFGQPVAEFDAIAWAPSLTESGRTEKLYLFDASRSSDAIKTKIMQSSSTGSKVFRNDLSLTGIDVHRIHVFVHNASNRQCPKILRGETTKNEHVAMIPTTTAFDRFVERTVDELGEIHPAPPRKYFH